MQTVEYGPSVESRLMSRVRRGGREGCWIWEGGKCKNGYANLHTHCDPTTGVTKKEYVHRIAYRLFVGPIPPGADVDHTCHNASECRGGKECRHRVCINPSHLEATTRGVNLHRGRTITARNAAKTHCLWGHEFTAGNTRVHRGKRYCRQCAKNRRATGNPRGESRE